MANRQGLPRQLMAGLQAYANVAIYEPAVVHLLLVGGVGAVPALTERRSRFRERLITAWQRPLDDALDVDLIAPQNTRRSAEALAGAFDEVILNLLERPDAIAEAPGAVNDMAQFAIRAVAYAGDESLAPL